MDVAQSRSSVRRTRQIHCWWHEAVQSHAAQGQVPPHEEPLVAPKPTGNRAEGACQRRRVAMGAFTEQEGSGLDEGSPILCCAPSALKTRRQGSHLQTHPVIDHADASRHATSMRLDILCGFVPDHQAQTRSDEEAPCPRVQKLPCSPPRAKPCDKLVDAPAHCKPFTLDADRDSTACGGLYHDRSLVALDLCPCGLAHGVPPICRCAHDNQSGDDHTNQR